MLQIYTDSKIQSSKDAQLFTKALINECVSQRTEYTVTGVINTDMPYVIPTPNDLCDKEIELLSNNLNNCEYYHNMSNLALNGIYKVSQYNELVYNEKSNIVIFGGSGHIATRIHDALKEDVEDLDIESVTLISSKTHPYDIAEALKVADIIVSAIPFDTPLIVDLYGFKKSRTVFDIGNNLSHKVDDIDIYFDYRKLGKKLTENIVGYAKNREVA